ncbi:MAG: hypothetical protein KAT37_03550 [Candidatus Aenigmarchaeota archaeon]|nr:hypothetical protein [Candidatus Aenigmarchaeota archaeon]
MLSKLLITWFVISVFLVSGCVSQTGEIGDTGTTGGLTGAQIEDQAADIIEQEMEEAIENIDLGDIEDSIPE